jgi:acetamidase/formamidase
MLTLPPPHVAERNSLRQNATGGGTNRPPPFIGGISPTLGCVTLIDLDSTAATSIDYYSAATAPVATVASGDTVTVHTLDANGHTERQATPGEDVAMLLPGGRGHCLVGPIAVEGAAPGMTLAVHIQSLRPDDWGFTSAGKADTPLNRRLGIDEPASLLWQLDADAAIGTSNLGHTVALAPFLGVIGVAPEPTGEFSTIPPRVTGGGNIDCRELVAGSTLFLPIAVDEALVYVGDGHAAQGDGEVGGTAIECGMTSRLTLEVTGDAALGSIHAITPAGRVTFGFDADLNEATAQALEAMIEWMQQLYSIGKSEALALASVVVSMRVTQVANQTWGVHALLPDGAIGQQYS